MSRARTVERHQRRIPVAELPTTVDEDTGEERQLTTDEFRDQDIHPWPDQPQPDEYVYALVLGTRGQEAWLGEYLAGRPGHYGERRTQALLDALEASKDDEQRSGTPDRRSRERIEEDLAAGRSVGRRRADVARMLREARLPQERPRVDEDTGETVTPPELSELERARVRSVTLMGDG